MNNQKTSSMTNEQIAEKWAGNFMYEKPLFDCLHNKDEEKKIIQSIILSAITEATESQQKIIEDLKTEIKRHVERIEKMISNMEKGDAVMKKATETFDKMEKYENELYRLLTCCVKLLDCTKPDHLKLVKEIGVTEKSNPRYPENRPDKEDDSTNRKEDQK